MYVDWSAGIPACMSAKHEKALAILGGSDSTPLNYAALQAGMPALQSKEIGEWRVASGE